MGLIESFAENVTFPVRIFKNERNLGSTQNFQKAIAICNGDLIALSDQDDEWYPDKLARMHRLFEELPEALAAFSDGDMIDDAPHSPDETVEERLFLLPQKTFPHVDTGSYRLCLRLDYIATGATMVFRSEFRGQFIPFPGSWASRCLDLMDSALRGGLAPLPAATIRYRVHKRQQIGVAPPSLADQLALAGKNAVYFRLVAERLKDLQAIFGAA